MSGSESATNQGDHFAADLFQRLFGRKLTLITVEVLHRHEITISDEAKAAAAGKLIDLLTHRGLPVDNFALQYTCVMGQCTGHYQPKEELSSKAEAGLGPDLSDQIIALVEEALVPVVTDGEVGDFCLYLSVVDGKIEVIDLHAHDDVHFDDEPEAAVADAPVEA